jgi:hypothetical protein
MQNVIGFLPFWSQVVNICNLVLPRPAECDHKAHILFGYLSFSSCACARDPERGHRICFTSWQQDFPAHGSDPPWNRNNQSDSPCPHWHLSAQIETWSLANQPTVAFTFCRTQFVLLLTVHFFSDIPMLASLLGFKTLQTATSLLVFLWRVLEVVLSLLTVTQGLKLCYFYLSHVTIAD